VKVFGANNTGWWSDVASGISWVVDQGAQVINLSVTGSVDSQAMQDAVAYANSKGVLVVVSAGNDSSIEAHYPASYDNVIAVGATTYTGDRWALSNYGPNVDVIAPGSLVWSTYTGGGAPIHEGTSMAAPHTAGVAALMLSVNPNLTPEEVKTVLQDTAVDMGDPGVDELHGHGLIDAGVAMATIRAGAAEPPMTGFDVILAHDLNDNGFVDPGDTLRYVVKAANVGDTPLSDVNITSMIPEHTDYVPGSVLLNAITVLDNTALASVFPLDENGLNIGSMTANNSSSISFDVVVQEQPRGEYVIFGKADVTSALGLETIELVTETISMAFSRLSDDQLTYLAQLLQF